ncbi:TPA: type II toxin-antitoxin system RelE/ParE family toxin [Yersinia enterocolitica]|nr:type II toxin-antitoxin system RelE/ParE family toxin [Yersinia enterocolitica]HDL7831926.1 type II toxin-antitoxin system RelE/ParE family toxin [Yersinia enterocolitica]HDL7872590.1 type II toxin-antitoxin system RelE/ParE family toxin [Yersinia enterocolitica]HDL7885433.1 type II toxin-antitoxin system RelE/ParE family toxin [Yersinia enterocolitica]HDL7893898.1 type II toxin-antitoxin system RelE/ParE family toxin [Yersinia enterocolitica]
MPNANNKNVVRFEYTETAKANITTIASFLKVNNVEPKSIIDAALTEFENKVGVFPESCPISPQLISIGCAKYRECNTKNGYRFLYSVNGNVDNVTCHAIIRQEQDLQGLLFSRMIER